nr:hypothetical protein [Chlamydiota bacterium]
QIEFVELEELLIGEKMAFTGGGMNFPMHSKFELATNGLTVSFIPTLHNIPQMLNCSPNHFFMVQLVQLVQLSVTWCNYGKKEIFRCTRNSNLRPMD